MTQKPQSYSVDDINRHLLFAMPKVKTDVGVLFGARSISGLIAELGAALYHSQRFPKIILTGGARIFQPSVALWLVMMGHRAQLSGRLRRDFLTAAREADHMLKIVTNNGVPEDAIVAIERCSYNTGQNVVNIEPLLREFNSATLVCTALHQRRALATVRKYFDIRKYSDTDRMVLTTHGVYPFGLSANNWHRNSRFRKMFFDEYAKMDRDAPGNYIAQGFCEDVDIPAEIRLAETLPALE